MVGWLVQFCVVTKEDEEGKGDMEVGGEEGTGPASVSPSSLYGHITIVAVYI